MARNDISKTVAALIGPADSYYRLWNFKTAAGRYKMAAGMQPDGDKDILGSPDIRRNAKKFLNGA